MTGKTAALILTLALCAPFAGAAQTASPATEVAEEPGFFGELLRDLRRWEIVAFGSFPFTMFFSTIGMDLYRWHAHNGMEWSDRTRAPWPIKSAGAVAMTDAEQRRTIFIAMGMSGAVAVADHFIERARRQAERRRAEAIPVGTILLLREPPEEPADAEETPADDTEPYEEAPATEEAPEDPPAAFPEEAAPVGAVSFSVGTEPVTAAAGGALHGAPIPGPGRGSAVPAPAGTDWFALAPNVGFAGFGLDARYGRDIGRDFSLGAAAFADFGFGFESVGFGAVATSRLFLGSSPVFAGLDAGFLAEHGEGWDFGFRLAPSIGMRLGGDGRFFRMPFASFPMTFSGSGFRIAPTVGFALGFDL